IPYTTLFRSNVHAGDTIGAPQLASTSPDHDTVTVSPTGNTMPGSMTIVLPRLMNEIASGVVARSNTRFVPRLPVTVITPASVATGYGSSTDSTGAASGTLDPLGGNSVGVTEPIAEHGVSSTVTNSGLERGAVPTLVSRT